MVGSLLGFAIALEAVAQGMKNLGDLRMAGRVFLPAKLPGNRPRAFARPAQRRLRIAPRCALDHLLQGVHKPGIGDREEFASRARPTDAAFLGRLSCFYFADALCDGFARKPAGATHQGDSSVAQTDSLIGRHEAARALVQQWPHRTKLLRQFGKRAHAQQSMPP